MSIWAQTIRDNLLDIANDHAQCRERAEQVADAFWEALCHHLDIILAALIEAGRTDCARLVNADIPKPDGIDDPEIIAAHSFVLFGRRATLYRFQGIRQFYEDSFSAKIDLDVIPSGQFHADTWALYIDDSGAWYMADASDDESPTSGNDAPSCAQSLLYRIARLEPTW